MNKVTEEELYSLYVTEEKPMHEIAKIKGIAIGSVYNYLKKYNIKTRDNKSSFSFKGKTHNQLSKEKISKIHKNKITSKETKEKISKARKGQYKIISEWGAHKKKRTDGYIMVYNPTHFDANKEGYILEHRLVMENVLGRILDKKEVVHHINGIRDDNRPENLVVFKNVSDHTKYHSYFRKINKKEAMTYQ